MKFCTYPYEYLLLDHFDGTVWLCPWMDRKYGIIGNLRETPALKLWHGEKAQQLRKCTSNGDFSPCRLEACPFLQNNSLPDVDEKNFKQKTIVPQYPKFINLAHDYICNLYCETCRPCKFVPPPNYHERLSIINEAIAPLLNEAETISLSGHGDPFASPYMLRLMERLQPSSKNTTINLETNGVLFTEKNWAKISHLSAVALNVIITVNSFDPFVYRHISRGGDYHALMKNLDFVSSLRKEHKIKKFDLAMVIQDRNFRQMPNFVETCLTRYCCDTILLRPVYQWGTMPDEVYWMKDVLNPLHPYHPEYLELLEHPALSHPKVYHFGGRTLHPARPYPVAKAHNGVKK